MTRPIALAILATLFVLAGLPQAFAQGARTWVSAIGDDNNPCSRTAPCKTFAIAINKTAAGGEISVIDAGGYGAVTITKSISIVSEGAQGSVLACGIDGIVVDAGAAAIVTLHGLFIEGCGNGLDGIKVVSAAAVHIRKCLIRGFRNNAGWGIEVNPKTNTDVFVSDCTVTGNARGILATRTAPGKARVFLDRVVVENNGNVGVRAMTGGASIFLNQSVVSNHDIGLATANNGKIVSFGNNAVLNNTTDGVPTTTTPLR